MTPKLKTTLTVLAAMTFFCSCASEQTKYHIGFSQCSDDEWRQQLNGEFLREMLFHPEAEVEILSADDNSAKQIADIERFINQKVDALIVAPNEAGAITPVVEKAFDAGIPVILVDRKISSSKYTAYVGADNYEIGCQVGSYIAGKIFPGCTVVEITGVSGSTPAEERHSGLAGVIAGTEAQFVSMEADWTSAGAFNVFRNYLAEGGKADIVFAHNDKMASGAHGAAESIRKSGKTTFIGIDALNGRDLGVDLVERGIIEASFIYPTGGDVVAQVTMSILQGLPYSRTSILPSEIVTQSNAKILSMQSSRITSLESTIKTLDNLLDSTMLRYTSQKKAFVVTTLLLVMVLVLLCIAALAIRKMYLMNKMLEQQKIQIERQREEKLAFFTNVSHDFRTPLTLIADPVKQLQKSVNLSEQDRFLLDIISKNVTVLRRLVNQILDFRKYESGKLNLHLSEFEPGGAIKDWVDSFSDTAWRKHINLIVDIDESCTGMKMVADLEKMERIIYNLLSNALKFTQERGFVKISLCYADNNFRLRVEDNGQGISEEHIRHIFENFYQVSSVHHTGSGIGLALVKAFVDMHSGTISVESREGEGTCFEISLPQRKPDSLPQPDAAREVSKGKMEVMKEGAVYDVIQSAASENSPKTELRDGKAAVVLVIDDNNDIRRYVASILDNRYEIIEATNGEEGLKKAVQYVPDAIICDVMMPVMDGMECCRRLKAEMRTSHIPVMMLTAYAAEDQKIEGYNCGADSYISKPFGADLLMARLKNLIEGRAKLQSIFGDTLPITRESIGEPDKDFVSKLRKLVAERLEDSSLTVEEVGAEMCLSRVQLYRKTKALTGYTPNEYIRIARLKKASSLLASTDRTVAEVAYSVGFTSASYFAKCYKEYFGESPADRKSKV